MLGNEHRDMGTISAACVCQLNAISAQLNKLFISMWLREGSLKITDMALICIERERERERETQGDRERQRKRKVKRRGIGKLKQSKLVEFGETARETETQRQIQTGNKARASKTIKDFQSKTERGSWHWLQPSSPSHTLAPHRHVVIQSSK